MVSLDEREVYILDRYGRNDPHRLAAIRDHCRSWRLVEAAALRPLPVLSRSNWPDSIDRDPSTCDFAGGSDVPGVRSDQAAMGY